MFPSLFSSFDPTSYLNFSLNWISILIMLILTPQLMWISKNKFYYMYYNLMKFLTKEMNMKNKNNMIIFISLFMMIFSNNLMGLMPYIFTSSSHMMFSMTFSLTLWMSFMLFGWMNNTNNMFTHLVPKSTPMPLMPFMVLIETISNMIRPYTLAIRLSANMIAGHILLTLLGNAEKNYSYIIMMILIQNLLMILEMSVTFIQAYVYSILSTLYAKESYYE